MCGIAGIIEFTGKAVTRPELDVLYTHIALRGPDASGVFIEKNVGFVHSRLSIVDLSAKGGQPMSVAHKGVVYTIVLNGEIYNFHELRDKYLDGIELQGSSDTEVLLWLYIIRGASVFNMLRGMFALAIYDHQNQKVVFARDHFGKKPLYFYHSAGKFIFSSDIKGIKAITSGLTLNYKTLNYYLSELTSPQPYTIWNQVSQLEPGSWMELDAVSGAISQQKFFSFPKQQKDEISFDDAIAAVESGLQNAIRKRQLADVPIGYFLSGGVDSGLIVALAARSSKIATYTVGYNNSEISELAEARMVAERYDTDHHEIIIEPDIDRDLEEIISYFGEPFADASAIPSYYITREMKKNVTVAISGDGGDELFGYQSYAFCFGADQLRAGRTLRGVRNKIRLSKALSRLSKSMPNYGMYESLFAPGPHGALFRRGMAFSEQALSELCHSPAALKEIGFTANYLDQAWTKNEHNSIADTVFTGSLQTRLLNDYLVKVDRMSMKNALEIRSPFLDVDFAIRMMRIPNQYKLADGKPKYILKKLAERLVAPDLLTRTKKGFGVPVNKWMRNELKSKVDHYLSAERIKNGGIFNPKYVVHLKNAFNNAQDTVTYELWTLLCFEIWLEHNLKN